MHPIKPLLFIITLASLTGCSAAPTAIPARTAESLKANEVPSDLLVIEASRNLDKMVGQTIRVVAFNPRFERLMTINMDGSGQLLYDESGSALPVRNADKLSQIFENDRTDVVRIVAVGGKVVRKLGVEDRRPQYALEVADFEIKRDYPQGVLVRRDLIHALEALVPKGPDSGLVVRKIETLAGVGGVYTFKAQVSEMTLAGPRERTISGTYDTNVGKLSNLKH